MNAIKKFIGGFSVVIVSFIAPNSVQAITWVYIGQGNGFEYYVDIDKEDVKDSLWTAPMKAVASDGSLLFGQVMLDCHDRTSIVEIANETSEWQNIESGSPISYVAEKVCY